MSTDHPIAVTGVERAAQSGGHFIEESVSVYLMGDPSGEARWVIDPTTISGEGLESTLTAGPESGNCECGHPKECAHRRVELEQVPLPDGNKLVVMLLDALTDAARTQSSHAFGGSLPVEVVSVRDPNGASENRVFVCGVEVPTREFGVDAGAGWSWPSWCEHRDRSLAHASPTAREVLLEAFRDPPGGKYIEGRANAGWLDRTPPENGLKLNNTDRIEKS